MTRSGPLGKSPTESGLTKASAEAVADGAPVDARSLMAVSRSLHPGRSWTSLAQAIYITALALGIAVTIFWTLWKRVGSFFVDVAGPYHVIWGTPAVVLLMLAIMRYSAVQGFASFSEADCLFLLAAPVARADLVRPRLRRAALALGLGGMVVGVFVAIASGGGSRTAGRFLEAAIAGLAIGVILVSAGWQVQRLRGAAVWVFRLTLPALAVAVLLAFAQKTGGAPRLGALWSGPWGWGLLSFGVSAWWAGLAGVVLLCVLAGAGWAAVRASAGAAPIEGFIRRARTRSQVVAGLYAFDARSVVLAGRQPRAERWRARLHIKAPRHATLAVPWHGLLVLLRSPARLAWAVVLGGGGALFLAVQPGRTGFAWAGGVALYLAASSLVEPLRLEVDSSAASAVLLPQRFGRILSLHCLAPAGIMLVIGLLATTIGWMAGYVAGITLATMALLSVPMVLLVVLAAALSARRGGRLPQSMLLFTAGDSTGISVIAIAAWIFGWAILGIGAVAFVAGLLGRPNAASSAGGIDLALVTFSIILWRVLEDSKR